MNTRDIGDVLEDSITKELEILLLENNIPLTKVKNTKASGAIRGDGDIRIQRIDRYNTPVILIDTKNHSSGKSAQSPTRDEVAKITKEAIKHFSEGGLIVTRNSNKETIASCDWKFMKELIKSHLKVINQ